MSWPIAALFAVSTIWGGAHACLAANAGDLAELRKRALELVNQSRLERGLPKLQLGANLNEAASSHAKDMLQRNYYAHTSPEGETVQDRYVEAGGSKWQLTAENIARCTNCSSPPDDEAVDRLHRGWMESPGHRHNILRKGLERFGFAIVSDTQHGLYAVQTFAGPGEPRGLEPDQKPTMLSPVAQTELALERINRAREHAGSAPLESSRTLIELAKSALPNPESQGFELSQGMDLHKHLPASQRRNWRSLSVVAAACGGCGTDPTDADVRYFLELWLDGSQYREALVGENATHLGLVIMANGDGKKIALAVFGRPF
jgi:uncharacterized protein YkwD